VVTIVDVAGRFVGRGLYNPRPALCCRVVTWRDEPVGDALLRRRIAVAVARRTEHGAPPTLARLVWSEADGLPGLVVDRYGPVAPSSTRSLTPPASPPTPSPLARAAPYAWSRRRKPSPGRTRTSS